MLAIGPDVRIAPMSKDRVAAAIALVQGSGPEARIYLVERARQLRFFGGYHALPGGVT